MKLRTLRVITSLACLTAVVALLFVGSESPVARLLGLQGQVVPSVISTCFGGCLFWLAVSLVAGRFYCSAACPVGALLDISARLRSGGRMRADYRYATARRLRYEMLTIYIVCLLAGIVCVVWVIEPWQMMANMAAAVRQEAVADTWLSLGLSAGVGIAAGMAALAVIVIWGALHGRSFCNVFCPLGALMGLPGDKAIFTINFNPDLCTGCLRCEEVCKGHCVKVVGRYVDNSRCVRCMNCVSVCPHKAITLGRNRMRPATPLFQRTKQTTPT